MPSHSVIVLDRPGEEWRAVEAELTTAGTRMALQHRSAWAERYGDHRLVVARDSQGVATAAFGVEVRPTRSLPGHRTLRVHHLGATGSRTGLQHALSALRDRVLHDRFAVQLDVATYSIPREPRAWLDDRLGELGFRRRERPESYIRTSLLDLRHDEAALLGRMSTMGRRNIRQIERRGLRIESLVDDQHLPRMNELVAETRTRTKGAVPRRSLAALLDLARTHPDLVRVVGLFPPDDDRLLAFASGLSHGDHVVYGDGASTRDPGSRGPLGYGLIWDLIRWSRERGAAWFDLGGITEGTTASHEDPLGGISDFKRQFRGAIGIVSEEWSFTPRPIRAAFAARAGVIARGLLRG